MNEIEMKASYLDGYKSAIETLATDYMKKHQEITIDMSLAETDMHSYFFLILKYVNLYIKYDDADVFIAAITDKGISIFNEDVYYLLDNPLDGITDLCCLFNPV